MSVSLMSVPATRRSGFGTWHWWAALTVLVLNDHCFKGSGTLPAALTGKLSDFAGLYAAPLLLAALIGAEGRRAWTACHAAVAVGFSWVQISPTAAQTLEVAYSLLGIEARVVADWTDLMALPMVALSHFAFQKHTIRRTERTVAAAEGLAVVVGCIGCVASSTSAPPVDMSAWGDLQYQTRGPILRNEGDAEVSVRVRPLAPRVGLDCTEIDRGRVLPLPDSAFGQAVRLELQPNENAPLDQESWLGEGRECAAALYQVGVRDWRIRVWRNSAGSERVPAQSEQSPRGVKTIVLADSEIDDLEPAMSARWPLEAAGENCRAIADPQLWATTAAPGDFEVLEIRRSADECEHLSLRSMDEAVDQNAESTTLSLCLNETASPFGVGDGVRLRANTNSALFVTSPAAELYVFRRQRLPVTRIVAEATATGDVGCGWQSSEEETRVWRGLRLRFATLAGAVELDPGETHRLTSGRREIAIGNLASANVAVAMDEDDPLASPTVSAPTAGNPGLPVPVAPIAAETGRSRSTGEWATGFIIERIVTSD